MMRWWWFGPAVEKTELARELRAMKAGGIGGAEIQPVYASTSTIRPETYAMCPISPKIFLAW